MIEIALALTAPKYHSLWKMDENHPLPSSRFVLRPLHFRLALVH